MKVKSKVSYLQYRSIRAVVFMWWAPLCTLKWWISSIFDRKLWFFFFLNILGYICKRNNLAKFHPFKWKNLLWMTKCILFLDKFNIACKVNFVFWMAEFLNDFLSETLFMYSWWNFYLVWVLPFMALHKVLGFFFLLLFLSI